MMLDLEKVIARAIPMMLLTGPILVAAGLEPTGAAPGEARGAGPIVTVRVSCEAMVPAYCRGQYGFEARSDGAWRVGPRPDGQVLTGQLSTAEAGRLRAATERALRRAADQPPTCAALGPIPGVRESITVTDRDRTVTLKGVGGRLDPSCSPKGATGSTALFALADRLMQRYYPHPF